MLLAGEREDEDTEPGARRAAGQRLAREGVADEEERLGDLQNAIEEAGDDVLALILSRKRR